MVIFYKKCHNIYMYINVKCIFIISNKLINIFNVLNFSFKYSDY